MNWVLRLNVDGSSIGIPGNLGGGGIIHDFNLQVMYAFSTFIAVKQIWWLRLWQY